MQHHALLLRQAVTAEAALEIYGPVDGIEVFVIPDSEIGIDEVRVLTIEASRRPRELSRRLLVVKVESLTFEAQQALLKLLEEPPETTSFLFVIPPEVSLLSTVASRFLGITPNGTSTTSTTEAFTTFSQSSVADRIEEIGKRMLKKDSAWTEAIKSGLAEYVSRADSTVVSLNALSFVLTHLNTRGASNKLLLEELALSLPPSRGAK